MNESVITATRAYRLEDFLNNYLDDCFSPFDIKSHQSYIDKAPLVDINGDLMQWVGMYQRQDGTPVKSHFRKYSPKHYSVKKINQEFCDRINICNESPLHKKAKHTMKLFLQKLVNKKNDLLWHFVDKAYSRFMLKGNLLSDVLEVDDEVSVETPFGNKYTYDIALIGSLGDNDRIILGAIELELTHKAEISKILRCKTLGYPLITIDLSGISEHQITEDWCHKILVATTSNTEDKRRKNYIHIHKMLYSIYTNIPQEIRRRDKHQYLIFARDNENNRVRKELEQIKEKLHLSKKAVLIQPVPLKNDQMITMFNNDGALAGKNWRDYNTHEYTRVTLEFPQSLKGNIYKFHLAMFSMLNSKYDTLVGYKYRIKITNDEHEVKYWETPVKEDGKFIRKPIIPKSLSTPIFPITRYLEAKGVST